jgi:two-component system phosphate regulon sensor histidine kinase PhoR
MTPLEIGLLTTLVIVLATSIVMLVSRTSKQKQREPSPVQSPPDTLPGARRDAPSAPFSPLFYAVASAIDSGLIIVNRERKVKFVNAQAEELLNINADTTTNQGLITLIRDYQADSMVSDVIEDNEAREATFHPVANTRTIHLRCVPLVPLQCTPLLENGYADPGGALLIIRDVTQLSILERSRRDLVANVSHELRTPLSSLKLLVETLQSEPPPEVAQRMLMQMAQEIDAVIQLADELHELSQIESGRITLQLAPKDMKAAIESAMTRIQPQAERKGIEMQALIPDNHVPVLMDDNRIKQLLLNLLHNAVKFTAEGGRITVQSCVVSVDEKNPRLLSVEQETPCFNVLQAHRGSSSEHPDTHVLEACPKHAQINLLAPHPPGVWMMTSVTDTGIGIPSQDLPRIFERFYKVDRSRTQTDGTGLGLAIAKHLIEGHGGRLWADSQEGRGSTFYFTLPVA